VVDPDDFVVIAAMGLEPVGSLLVPVVTTIAWRVVDLDAFVVPVAIGVEPVRSLRVLAAIGLLASTFYRLII